MMLRIEKRAAPDDFKGLGFVLCTTGIYVLLWRWSIDIEWGSDL